MRIAQVSAAHTPSKHRNHIHIKPPIRMSFGLSTAAKWILPWREVKWWSLIVLDGYSRTMLAGAVAPTEASWVALMALYTACLRYGVPKALISDSGGAFTSNEFEAVCTRLQIDHKPMESTKAQVQGVVAG